jgi:hypothetical protein
MTIMYEYISIISTLSFHSGHGFQSNRSTCDQFSSFSRQIMKGEMKVQWYSTSAIYRLQKTVSYESQIFYKDLLPYKMSGPYIKWHCFHLRSLYDHHAGVTNASKLRSTIMEWHDVHTMFYENQLSGSNSWKGCLTHGHDETITLSLLITWQSRLKTTRLCLTPTIQGKIIIQLLLNSLNVW